jgi:hypothetical protein
MMARVAMADPVIDLMTGETLAHRLGYGGVTNAFRDWCVKMRITPVPGRRGYYDPVLVRRRLDEAQGLASDATLESGSMTPLEKRRARRGED